MARHPLARKDGIELFASILGLMGAVCPDCGYGTRATSKRWAKCKRCGRMKIRRRTDEEVQAVLRDAFPDVWGVQAPCVLEPRACEICERWYPSGPCTDGICDSCRGDYPHWPEPDDA